MISFAGAAIICGGRGEGFWSGIPKVADMDGKSRATGDCCGGRMGVDSEGEVPVYIPEEIRVGAVVQTLSSSCESFQALGMLMQICSGI